MNRKRLIIDIPWPDLTKLHLGRRLPTPGNVIFTVAMIGLLIAAQSVGALPLSKSANVTSAASTGTIAYQGRLADSDGAPLTGTYSMIFRLYETSSGGVPLWEEQWTGPNGVKVSDGLFNVMLGSLTPIPQAIITGHDQLFLGITVGTDDEMAPRVQLGSVPYATQALTVPDGSITAAKLALRAEKASQGVRWDNTTPVDSTENIAGVAVGPDAANFAGANITTSGGDVLILATVLASAASTRTYVVWALLDNAVVCRAIRPIDTNVGTSVISCLAQDVPAGTHTVLLKHSVGPGEPGSDIYLRDRVLNVIEVGK